MKQFMKEMLYSGALDGELFFAALMAFGYLIGRFSLPFAITFFCLCCIAGRAVMAHDKRKFQRMKEEAHERAARDVEQARRMAMNRQ